MTWVGGEETRTWRVCSPEVLIVMVIPSRETLPRRASRVASPFPRSMHAVTKSRHRHARRASSSDHIEEEEDPSQRHADDVDNEEESEEDVQPVRKTTTVKMEKKPKINRSGTEPPAAGPSNANHNDDDDDDDGRIDIQNFHDQPLDRKEGAKLHGIAQDWEMIRKQIHQGSFRLVKDVAVSLAEVMEVGEAGEVGAVIPRCFVVNE